MKIDQLRDSIKISALPKTTRLLRIPFLDIVEQREAGELEFRVTVGQLLNQRANSFRASRRIRAHAGYLGLQNLVPVGKVNLS